ncbi:MAG: hypothetical protein IJY06_09680, partial [Oscillospiraceae bacterium]|nr:hypothetical protein [Oscillospiraceae bacterium]
GQKFLIDLFSKRSWGQGAKPLVAHRSERNLLMPSLFSGVNLSNSPVDGLKERGSFLQKTPPYCSLILSFLSANAETK